METPTNHTPLNGMVPEDYNMNELIKIGQFLANLMNSKVPITQKLCSKKLWVAFAGVLAGFLGAHFGDNSTASAITNTVLEIGSVVFYLVSETMVDRARANQNAATVNMLSTMVEVVGENVAVAASEAPAGPAVPED